MCNRLSEWSVRLFKRQRGKTFDLRYENTRQQAIIASASWFLWVNILFSCVVLLRAYFNQSVEVVLLDGTISLIYLPVLAIMVIAGGILYILFFVPNRQALWLWSMLRIVMVVLSLLWCITLFMLFSSGGRPIIFALASLLLLTSLVSLYFDARIWFCFSVPLEITIIALCLVYPSYITVTNVLAYLSLTLLVESARRMLNNWFILALRREQENIDLINRLEIQANCDPLTGLANRRAFQLLLDKTIQRKNAQQGTFAMIMVDVDKFKNYNDFYGHQAGDDCLVQVASVMENAVRRYHDMVARFGGEEFIILLPDATEPDALDVALRIHRLLEEKTLEHQASDVAPLVTISMGIAIWSPGLSPSRLISRADSALYYAKTHGRNQTQLFRSEMQGMVMPDKERKQAN